MNLDRRVCTAGYTRPYEHMISWTAQTPLPAPSSLIRLLIQTVPPPGKACHFYQQKILSFAKMSATSLS